MKLSSFLVGIAAFLGLAAVAHAEIVIGQTAGLTGAASSSVQDMTLGARLIIDAVNAEGGVNGEKIRLVTIDDELLPEKTLSNATRLIEKEKAVALFLTRGTPNTEILLPLLAKTGVPLIAPSTGAMSLHQPVIREVFNVRPTYQLEAQKAVELLASMNVKNRVGVVYTGDTFGEDALAGLKKGFSAAGITPAFVVSYDRKTENVDEAVKLASTPIEGEMPSVIIVAPNRIATGMIRKLRSAGNKAYMATLSTNASDGFIKNLGVDANYVIVSQAFPSERAFQFPIVRKVSGLLAKSGKGQGSSPSMLEGAIAAEVLVGALRGCAPKCTSARIIEALESGRPFDVGLLDQQVVFTKKDHSGIRYTDTSIIVGVDENGKGGRFRR
ncbi:ABC transporter substrate-binding protein [Piscinibacter gummiphilus]|uniref:ABC transporter substrate-binding protein n=1 Tax=Piscinibacter gummiphilus TaxID=946333 RepID=A0ABZ0D1Q6_9BURK|nr:ABC transporter substrate-binding protein [Piscinibacter gummiphilus]WOB11182.1 ABC transporter substrate-binding protein [Piscinibacter gummiphilus]